MSLAGTDFHGLLIELRNVPGARAMRVIHSPRQAIAEHGHDWPSLTLPVLGQCTETCASGVMELGGPSAVLHPAAAFHSDAVADTGMETVSIQFDPAWLGNGARSRLPSRTRFVKGGATGAAAMRLAQLWVAAETPAEVLLKMTTEFVNLLSRDDHPPPKPSWISWLSSQTGVGQQRTADVARKLGVHPAWLARAYRAATGEGLHETARRRRMERAVFLLRCTEQPLAEIALASGFCDQSHMNRNLRHFLGRTPLEIRAEGRMLMQLEAACSARQPQSPSSYRRTDQLPSTGTNERNSL